MITVKYKDSDKGYVFKTKSMLKQEQLNNLYNQLKKGLENGILIYPSEILELVDTYNIYTTTESISPILDEGKNNANIAN